MIDSRDVQHVFVSPHLDDVVFSCGGLIAAMVRSGVDVSIVTVFTAQPYRLNAEALLFHRECGMGVDGIEKRRNEDLAAARILGVTTEHLGLFEAIYRVTSTGVPRYSLRDESYLEVTTEPATLRAVGDVLRMALRNREKARIYAPLGIGRHVDHLMVRSAIEHHVSSAAPPNCNLAYYEELPYGRLGGRYALRPPEPVGWRRECRPKVPSERDWRVKWAACLAYTSQTHTLWASEENMRSCLLLVDGRSPEAIWGRAS